MKILNKNLKGLIVLVMLAMACTPNQDFPELQNPLALKPGLLNGTWSVVKVVQYDKEASDDGFPTAVQERDITLLFPFTTYKVTFNLQNDGRPGTFTVTPGTSPNFLSLNEGIWTLDDYVFATTISLTNPAEVNASAFRVKVLDKNAIRLQVVRNDALDNTEYSYYEYEFTK